LPCCDKTVPILSPDASVLMVKESLKLGITNVDVVVIACLRTRKVVSASSFQPNFPFLSRLFRGCAMMP
jgi:hypothetical protein